MDLEAHSNVRVSLTPWRPGARLDLRPPALWIGCRTNRLLGSSDCRRPARRQGVRGHRGFKRLYCRTQGCTRWRARERQVEPVTTSSFLPEIQSAEFRGIKLRADGTIAGCRPAGSVQQRRLTSNGCLRAAPATFRRRGGGLTPGLTPRAGYTA